MRGTPRLAAVFALTAMSGIQPLRAQRAPDPAVRARVDSLLSRMTLEEKVGQMTQLTVGVFTVPGRQPPGRARLDLVKLREGIVRRHTGSTFNVPEEALSLRRFERVTLAPGESRRVAFTLAPDALRFVARNGTSVLEPGAFDVMVGDLKTTFQLVGTPPPEAAASPVTH